MFSVIIPNYNGEKYLKACLDSVEKAAKGLVKRVIVVDNGSKDRSRDLVPQSELKTTTIINPRNYGFAKAVNQGIKRAKTDYVVVMNNDLVIAEDWFGVMAKAIKEKEKKEKIAAYFGKVLTRDSKKIESTGLIYWRKGKAFNRGNGEPASSKKYNKEEFIWGASASIVVYSKAALFEAGLFDEDFFAYEEDVDLALRLRDKGWKILYLPGAVSYHLGGGTSQRMGNFRRRMDAKNWWFIILKNYPKSILLKHFPEILTERLRNVSGLIKGTPFYRIPWDLLRTYGEIMLKLPKILKKRKPVSEMVIQNEK